MDISKISEPQAPASVGNVISSFLPVKRSELLTVMLLSLNVFILLTVYYVLKVVREPLILLGGGGAELKAYASGGQTILLLGVVPAFSWLSSRVSRIRLMTTMGLIFMGCLVVFGILVEAKAPIGLAFYLWVGIFNVLVVSNFWSFANDLFTEEEGKRVFAIIGVGASIGAIVGAFVPHVLHAAIGVRGLMTVAVVGLGVSILLYQIVDRRELEKKALVKNQRAAKEPEKLDKKGGFTLVIKDKYLRLLALMLLVATVINTTGEYVIGKMATDRSVVYAADKVAQHAPPSTPDPTKQASAPKTAADSEADAAKDATDAKTVTAVEKAAQDDYLSSFYSSYYTLVNLISALLQAVVVAWLLTKFGVRRSLFIMPLIVLGGWFALILFVNVTMVRIEKTAENSLDYSLHNTLRQALFLPTSRASKYKAKAAIDTFFFRMGDVIAGIGIVSLFVEVLHLGVHAFAIMNVVLALIWVVLAARTGRLHDKLVAEQGQTSGAPAA